jgi:hypothetical protein
MALTDYSDLEKEIKDAPQPKTLPKGTEVKARIIGINSGTSEKNGADWFSPRFDVPADPMVIEFNTFFWALGGKSKELVDPKQYARNLYQFQQFVAAFKLDISKPFDMESDWIGKTGYVQVGVQHSDQYGDQNTVSKFVAGPGGNSPSAKGPVSDDDIPF